MVTIYLNPSSEQDTKYLEDFLGNNMDDPLAPDNYNNPFDRPNFGHNNRQWIYHIQGRKDCGSFEVRRYTDEDIEIRELSGSEKDLKNALGIVNKIWKKIESGALSDGIDSIVLKYQEPQTHPQD